MRRLTGRRGCFGRGCCLGGCALELLSLLAVVLVIAIWVLQRHPGEDWWATMLLTWGPQPQWIVPPALMMLLTMIARRPALTLLNLSAAIFALLFIADFQLNLIRPELDYRPVIRAATWNVHGYTRDRGVMQQKMAEWDADIICLQEAAAGRLDDLLPGYDSVYHGPLRVLVRGEILHHETVQIGEIKPRDALLVVAETDAGTVTVINLHLPRTLHMPLPTEAEALSEELAFAVEERGERIARLIEALPDEGPVLLMGDFNTPPQSRFWRELDGHLIDAFDATGFGFGYTFLIRFKYPLLRIDYIWAGGGAEPIAAWIEPEEPSDHRPVLADIALPAPDEPIIAVASDG